MRIYIRSDEFVNKVEQSIELIETRVDACSTWCRIVKSWLSHSMGKLASNTGHVMCIMGWDIVNMESMVVRAALGGNIDLQ